MQPYRVAIGGIFTECNHLGGVPLDLRRFEQNELLRGADVAALRTGVVGGMLHTLSARKAEPMPLLYASACPGGPLTSECYRRLKGELIARLRNALPIDGVLLPLHGSATVEDVGDLEGDLIGAVREIVGPQVPVVATLDLHAHVTADMVRGADALVAWETYPHRDAFSTGERGANLLLNVLQGLCRPTMAMAKVPVLVSGIHGSTEGEDAFGQIMRFAKSYEGHTGVLSLSVFLVHPYLDLPEMGSGGLVITDDDMEGAVALARRIAERYWERRFDLEPRVYTPQEAISRGEEVEGGPVVLVETADCCGGGAAGDSVATLRALMEENVREPALVPVVDAEAAAVCHRAGTGADLTIPLGHKHDPKWGEPMMVAGRVTRLTDGRFRYVGGMWDGMEGNMGPSAVLQIGSVQVLVTTYPTYDWADEQFRSVGLNPASAKFLVAKNPMNYRLAYGRIARAAFVLDTPGPTPPTVRHVRYNNLQRPCFPFDQDIPGLTPTILRNERGESEA